MQDDQRHLIRERVEQARADSPSGGELEGARVGEPVLVRDPGGEPACWFVPFLRDDLAAGFATLALSGTVQRIGTFGSGRADRSAWIPASYFARPPEDLVGEVRARYAGSSLSDPLFTFDGSPSRWAWRLQVDPPGGDLIFIAPRGWYARPAGGADQPGRE